MTTEDGVTIRRGTRDDARACHDVLWRSVTDLAQRHATPLDGTADEWWVSAEPLHRFLAEHAAEWWLAEDLTSATLIGYARSISREGLLELTEFFVIPGHQSAGLGRALLERAFPEGRGEVRSIIATTDTRAQSRYVRAGTTAQFPFFSLVGEPREASPARALTTRGIGVDAVRDRGLVRDIERAVLGYPRGDEEIRWLLEDRDGFLYQLDDAAVGFAFLGQHGVGPIAVLEPEQLPEVLLDIEARAAAAGITRLDFQVPAPNAVATRHLLGRGFRFDPWINLLMASRPYGSFDRFIGFGPPMFL